MITNIKSSTVNELNKLILETVVTYCKYSQFFIFCKYELYLLKRVIEILKEMFCVTSKKSSKKPIIEGINDLEKQYNRTPYNQPHKTRDQA